MLAFENETENKNLRLFSENSLSILEFPIVFRRGKERKFYDNKKCEGIDINTLYVTSNLYVALYQVR